MCLYRTGRRWTHTRRHTTYNRTRSLLTTEKSRRDGLAKRTTSRRTMKIANRSISGLPSVQWKGIRPTIRTEMSGCSVDSTDASRSSTQCRSESATIVGKNSGLMPSKMWLSGALSNPQFRPLIGDDEDENCSWSVQSSGRSVGSLLILTDAIYSFVFVFAFKRTLIGIFISRRSVIRWNRANLSLTLKCSRKINVRIYILTKLAPRTTDLHEMSR